MKLAKIISKKRLHGIELRAYCPDCDVLLDVTKLRPVARDYQKSVILTGKCSKCHHSFHAVVRLN